MKTLNSLLLASAAWLTLVGCGATDNPAQDTTVISKGESNRTITGGFWWTYVDRAIGANPKSEVVPNTGKLDPDNPTATALGPSLSSGVGIMDDGTGTGNMAFHVTGQVRPSPKWTDSLGVNGQSKDTADTYDYRDIYWDTHYGALCKDGKCLEVKYPSAGLGFGFQLKNKAIDLSAYYGIGFKIRNDGMAVNPTSLISISLPMDITDVPDPSFGDQFGAPQGDGSTFQPYCTFPGTPLATATTGIVGGNTKNCFKNYTNWPTPTDPKGNKTVQAPGVLMPNCMLWSDFTAPTTWGGDVTLPGVPGALAAVDPTRIVKMQFDAYKPLESEAAAVPFDFWIDDVVLITCENWDSVCGATAAAAAKPAACAAAPAGG
jgi:hypothetical protein